MAYSETGGTKTPVKTRAAFLAPLIPFLPTIGMGISAIGAGISSSKDRKQRESEMAQSQALQREQMGIQKTGLLANMRNQSLQNATRYDFMRSIIDAQQGVKRG